MTAKEGHVFVHYSPDTFAGSSVASGTGGRLGRPIYSSVRGDECHVLGIALPTPHARQYIWTSVGDCPQLRTAQRPQRRQIWHIRSAEGFAAGRRDSTHLDVAYLNSAHLADTRPNSTYISNTPHPQQHTNQADERGPRNWFDSWFQAREPAGEMVDFHLARERTDTLHIASGIACLVDPKHNSTSVCGMRAMYGTFVTHATIMQSTRLTAIPSEHLLAGPCADRLHAVLLTCPIGDLQGCVDELLRVPEEPVDTTTTTAAAAVTASRGTLGLLRDSKLYLWSKGAAQFIVYRLAGGRLSTLVAGDTGAVVHELERGDWLVVVPVVLAESTLRRAVRGAEDDMALAAAGLSRCMENLNIRGDFIMARIG